jgi:uncharacterized delta-60 repeat protein
MKIHAVSMLLSTAVALFTTTSNCHAGLYDIDTSFANSGRLNLTFPGADFRTLAHLARPDGTSIAVVTYDNNGCPAGRHCIGLYPFDAAGDALPPISVPTTHSFSKRTGGIVLDPYLVRAAAIDSQGRIVIAGTEQFGSALQFKVIRLLPTGQPDTSFDGDGIALPGNFTSQNNDVAEAMAIDASGRIVVAGSARFSATDTDFAVLRLTSAGALDTSFSSGGKLTIAFDLGGAGVDGATALALRVDQIYLAGYAKDGSTTRIALAKVLPAGTLDGNFCPTTCTFQGPYTTVNSGKRVLFFGQAEDNLSDFVRSAAVNVSGEMVYAGLHETGNVAFRVFTQKVALNGDYANEGLTDVGLPEPLQYFVGGIRYFNPNSGTSNLVLTGSVGPDSEFFFAQGLSGTLAPLSNWGTTGTNSSALLYSASGGFGDNPGDRPTIPGVDSNARVLLGGSYKASASDSNYSINLMRLNQAAPADLIFRDGFQ